MNFFCDNAACACHVESPEGKNAMKFVAHNGTTVEMRRFKVVVSGRPEPLHFCSVCVNVVSLTNK